MLSWGLGAGALALPLSSMLELSKEQLHLRIPNPGKGYAAGRRHKCPPAFT